MIKSHTHSRASPVAPSGPPRWRRWLVGVMPWLLFLGTVALMSPLRS